jgi:hypothetical protein
MASKKEVEIESGVNEIFSLPLSEFTAARNVLAARLKASGNVEESERVKALPKPPISAWAVNQLYFKRPELFERLLSSGERYRRAQTAQMAGQGADVRGPQEERRAALLDLSRLAGEILQSGGHSATPETMRRITATLEALSVYGTSPDAPLPGQLTDDVAPPGFDALAALITSSPTPSRPKPSVKKLPQEQLAEAKLSVRNAKHTLAQARGKAEKVAAALKEATADAADATRELRKAEERWQKARALSEESDKRVRDLAAESGSSAKQLEEAEREFENATRQLDTLQKKN